MGNNTCRKSLANRLLLAYLSLLMQLTVAAGIINCLSTKLFIYCPFPLSVFQFHLRITIPLQISISPNVSILFPNSFYKFAIWGNLRTDLGGTGHRFSTHDLGHAPQHGL